MKKLLFYLVLFLVLISSIIRVAAVDDPELQSLMKRGKIITCLKAAKVNSTQDEWKSVDASMNLTGSCDSKNNCEIWRCNGINNEIAQDKALLKICEKKPSSRASCSKPGKIDLLKTKIKNSVEVTAGCQKISNFNPSIGGGMVGYGDVNVTSDQKFVPHVDYKFYTSGEAGAGPISTPVEQGVIGNDNSQQIGEITNFETPTVPGSDQDCTGITWDPYGRVFDAASLEPISDVKVTMIDNKTKKPAIQQFESNFDFTNLSGVFNILVEKEGEYQLDVLSPSTHLFINNLILHPNFSLIYSDIYYPGNVYMEKQGVPTHHDIPLKPKSTPYYQAGIDIIPGSLNQIDMGKFVSYGGRTTFPKTLVCLLGEISKKQTGDCVNADKIGKFSLNIDKIIIPQGERLIIQLKKVDLTSKSFSPVGQAIYPTDEKGKNYGFEPILNHVEGYIYNNNQASSPTKVIVKSVINDQQFYETVTDDSGFFTIYAENLPIFEYYLEFTNPNKNVTKQTTSEFVKKNQSYLDSEKINLMQGTKQNQKIINPDTGKLNEIVKDSNPLQQNNKMPTSTKNIFSPITLMIILIISLLIIITVGLVLYIRKSKTY